MWVRVPGFRDACERLGYFHSVPGRSLWPASGCSTLRIAWDLEAWLQQALVAGPLADALSQRPGSRASWQVTDDCALLNAYGFVSPSLQARAIADLERWLEAFTLDHHGQESVPRSGIQIIFLYPSQEIVHWCARSPCYRAQEAKQRRAQERAWHLLQTGTTNNDRGALLAGKRRMATLERIRYPTAVWWQLQQALLGHQWRGARLTFLDTLPSARTDQPLPWVVAADLYASGLVDAVYAPMREALVLANVPEAVLLLHVRTKSLTADHSVHLIELIAGWPASFARYGAQACAIAGLEPCSRSAWSPERGHQKLERFEDAMALASASVDHAWAPSDTENDLMGDHAERNALTAATALVTGSPYPWSASIPCATDPSAEQSSLRSKGSPGESPRGLNEPMAPLGKALAQPADFDRNGPDGPQTTRASVRLGLATPPSSTPSGNAEVPAIATSATLVAGSTPRRASADPIQNPEENHSLKKPEHLIHNTEMNMKSQRPHEDGLVERSNSLPHAHGGLDTDRGAMPFHLHHHDSLPLVDTPYLRHLSGQTVAWRKASMSVGSHSQWYTGRVLRWEHAVGPALESNLERFPLWLQGALERARVVDKQPILQALEALDAVSLEAGGGLWSLSPLWPWMLLVLALALGWFAVENDHWQERASWWVLTDKAPVHEPSTSAMTKFLLTRWPFFLAEQIAASEMMNAILGVHQPGLVLACWTSPETYAHWRMRFWKSLQHIRSYLDQGTWSALEEVLKTTTASEHEQTLHC